MELHKNTATFYAKNRKAWRNWLIKNHQIQENIFLIIYKKDSGTPSVYYPEAVDEALCFGWIDSKINKRDEKSYYQYFAKRNSKSNWSKVNKDKVSRLMAANLMMPAGLAAIDVAKKNGTWDALNEIEELVIPNDLQQLLQQNNTALTNFTAFPRSAKRGILEWIATAKTDATRLKRITTTVEKASINKKAYFPDK
jgi:uncharacterized protein YdeI (YjbR/CyaY-like superfamily)